MSRLPTINPRIVDALYCEALVLADEVRAQFDRARTLAQAEQDLITGNELDRVALSCEALRTTTRVMHCMAWLLNHRAYFAGDLSELQLRRHGKLIGHFAPSDPETADKMPDGIRRTIDESERLYQRIQRLEDAWRGASQANAAPGAIERLRERLAAQIH
jgi:regulator of CtrA degradation